MERHLAQLSVIIEGKEVLLRQGDGLIEPGGQLRLDFEAAEVAERSPEGLEDVPAGAEGVVPVVVGRAEALHGWVACDHGVGHAVAGGVGVEAAVDGQVAGQ